jgi:hypothetical protein
MWRHHPVLVVAVAAASTMVTSAAARPPSALRIAGDHAAAQVRTVSALGTARPDVVAGYADLGDHVVVYVARSVGPRQRLTMTRQLYKKAPLVEGAGAATGDRGPGPAERGAAA